MRTITDKLITNYLPSALNRYLALDPESHARLHELKNKIVTIELLVNETPLYKESITQFQMQFSETGIKLKTAEFSMSDTHIKGTPLSLLRMALTNDDRKKFFSEDVSIEGNLELGQQVIALFDALEIDWEEYLSRWVGDISAHQLTRFARKIKNISKRFQSTLTQNINEYVHEEVDLFPPPEALHDFFHDVDTLRMDADRLEARIQKLTLKIASKRDHS
jgi:ubiquinone biosynthesis protein UbiJ